MNRKRKSRRAPLPATPPPLHCSTCGWPRGGSYDWTGWHRFCAPDAKNPGLPME